MKSTMEKVKASGIGSAGETGTLRERKGSSPAQSMWELKSRT